MVSRVFFGSVPPYHAYAWLKEVLKSLFFFLFLKGFLSPQSKAMGILLLFAIFLFTCGFINYYRFLPRSQIIAWLCSLLPADSSPPKLADKHSKVEEEEDDDDDDEIGSLASDDDDLQIIFSTFDKDGDGFITVKELEESLRRLGLTVTDNELVSMVERVDANGDGLIDLEEFRELYAEVGRDRESGNGDDGHERDEIAKEEEEDVSLREAFGVFDGNGDGMITAEELAMVLSSLGLKQGARLEDCREMIRRVDRDGDGKVNFKEFKNMMKMKRGKLF